MNDTEKMTVARLLMAIEDARQPISYYHNLPLAPGEWDNRTAAVAQERERREAALAKAITDAKALIA
jgi:hypothetical protein